MQRGKCAKTRPHTEQNHVNLLDMMQSCSWHELCIWPTDMLLAALSLCKRMREMAMQSLQARNCWSVSLRINLVDSTKVNPSFFKFYVLSLPNACKLVISKHNTRSQMGMLCVILSLVQKHLESFPGPSSLVIEDHLPPKLKKTLVNLKRLESLEFDMSIFDKTLELENWLMQTNADTLRRIKTTRFTTFTLREGNGIQIKNMGLLQKLEDLTISDMRLKNWRDSITLSSLFIKIKSMTSLKRLDLSGNSLTCNNLLNVTQVRNMLLSSFINLSNLTRLKLRNCDLRTTAFLKHCKKLEELDLGENSRLDFEDFYALDHDFDRFDYEKKTLLQAFGALQNLKRLYLDRCRMSAHSLYTITHSMAVRRVSIEFIDFSHNQGLFNDDKTHFWISVILLDLIQNLKFIKEAHLNGIESNLGKTTKNLKLFTEFKCKTNLRVLSLVENGFCLKETKEAVMEIFDERVKVFI